MAADDLHQALLSERPIKSTAILVVPKTRDRRVASDSFIITLRAIILI